ncbi:two-component system, OmpR family, sensor histidine kinase QseC [Burkholderiales bacterium]|nr:two-component system, OmpR family, sensor histidine kinase QseC [Burkholderiales bacterium]
MRIRHSLKLKFAFTFALAGLLLVLSHALALHLLNRHQEAQLIDQIVADELEDVLQQYERRGIVEGMPYRSLPRHEVRPDTEASSLRKWFRANWLAQGYVARSVAERALLPEEVRDLEPGFHDVETEGRRYRVGVRDIGNVRFYAAYLVALHQERALKFTWALALTAALTALLTVLAGLWLSSRLTRQIVDLAQRVASMDSPVFAEPLRGNYHEREVAELAAAFDDYHQRTARLLARERAFTADVSHELRTPLTTIQTSSELLLEEELPTKARERVERIARGASRLSGLVNVFLLLAREQDGGERDAIDLRECAEQAFESVRERALSKGLALELAVPAGIVVFAPRNALLVVLTNLLGNAVRYTEKGGIRLSATARTVEIEDTGPGVDPGRIPELFRRFRRGDLHTGDGFGLGLAIVKRICEQVGWMIGIEPRQEGGTRVRLTFAQ